MQETILSFTVNRWHYNYSLEKAVALELAEGDASPQFSPGRSIIGITS